jgi:hypothetical protein
MRENRYFLVVIGPSKDIDEDLNHIATPDGVHYVDGNGIFMATFYSTYKTDEVYNMLAHRNAYLLFDINDFTKYGINLPSKFYKGLFPEIEAIIPKLEKEVKKEEDLTDINEILDKLSKNNYNTDCLTEKEFRILRDVE